MLDKLNLLNGIITYDSISWLGNNESEFINNKDNLTEDLLQISFSNEKYIVDVGWYPEFDENGQFTVLLIHNLDWQKPLRLEKVKTIKDLINAINKSIDLIDEK